MTTPFDAVQILQALLRFDTTNPPGNEAACIAYAENLLRGAGLQTTILARDPARPNLLARLPGDGRAPGLLLQGHVDVVTTADQAWSRPPFAGLIEDGYIWGRGALDMKGGVAMLMSGLLRLAAEGVTPAGDITLCLLSDEEAGGAYGAKFLVEEHPGRFAGIRYALGEFGGFTLYFGDTRYYPIQVDEKLQCQLRLTISGPAGHGSQPIRGGAMARLGRVLRTLDEERLPVHVTPVAGMMLDKLAEHAGGLARPLLRQMTRPRLAAALLDSGGERLRVLEPLLRNTVSPTIVRGGAKINVIPGRITLDLDGRMLPGFRPEQMVAELRALLGDDGVAIEVLHYDPPHTGALDMGLFDRLAGVLQELDPEGVPLPYMLPAVSDARFFARLGIQPYGFVPLRLPRDFDFLRTIHAADERVPLDAIAFGAEAIYRVLSRYGR